MLLILLNYVIRQLFSHPCLYPLHQNLIIFKDLFHSALVITFNMRLSSEQRYGQRIIRQSELLNHYYLTSQCTYTSYLVYYFDKLNNSCMYHIINTLSYFAAREIAHTYRKNVGHIKKTIMTNHRKQLVFC